MDRIRLIGAPREDEIPHELGTLESVAWYNMGGPQPVFFVTAFRSTR